MSSIVFKKKLTGCVYFDRYWCFCFAFFCFQDVVVVDVVFNFVVVVVVAGVVVADAVVAGVVVLFNFKINILKIVVQSPMLK